MGMKLSATQGRALKQTVSQGYLGTGSARFDTMCALKRAGLVTLESKVETYRTRMGFVSPCARYYIDWLAKPTEAGRAYIAAKE
jgi:hypothetical protein